MRRCRKSTLLKQAIEEIKGRRINEDHIVHINFGNLDFSKFQTKEKLYTELHSNVKDEGDTNFS